MKSFNEVESGDNLFIFVEDLDYTFIKNVKKVEFVKYDDMDIVELSLSFSSNMAYNVIGDDSMWNCRYYYKGEVYDAIVFTTKYEMESYVKKLAMKYSEKVFNLNELLYHI